MPWFLSSCLCCPPLGASSASVASSNGILHRHSYSDFDFIFIFLIFVFLRKVDQGAALGLFGHYSAYAAEPFAPLQLLCGEGEPSRAVLVFPPWELLAAHLHQGFPSLSHASSCAIVKWTRKGRGEPVILLCCPHNSILGGLPSVCAERKFPLQSVAGMSVLTAECCTVCLWCCSGAPRGGAASSTTSSAHQHALFCSTGSMTPALYRPPLPCSALSGMGGGSAGLVLHGVSQPGGGSSL